MILSAWNGHFAYFTEANIKCCSGKHQNLQVRRYLLTTKKQSGWFLPTQALHPQFSITILVERIFLIVFPRFSKPYFLKLGRIWTQLSLMGTRFSCVDCRLLTNWEVLGNRWQVSQRNSQRRILKCKWGFDS